MAKKVIKDLLKKAMANGDQSSAANAYKSMAAKKDTVSIPKQTYFSNKPTMSLIERMGKKSLIKKAKPDTVKIDSTKKVTPIGGSKPSVMIKKQTTIKPAKPVAKNMPYKPNAVAKQKAKGVSLIKVSVGKIKK